MTKKIQYKGNIIEFPDNVTNEQIVDFLKNQDIATKTDPVSFSDRARLVGQGVTLGFGDEIVAGAKALNPFSDKTYSEAVKEERDKIANFRQARPKESIALELAGGLFSPVGSFGLVAKAPTTAKRLTELAKEGAKVGGIYGVGTGEGVVDRAESGLKSALTGAIANPLIGKVVSKLKPKQTSESARVQEKFGEEPTELRKLGGAFQTVDELTESIPLAGGMLKKSRETKLSKSLNSLINNSVEKGTGKSIPNVKKLNPEEAVQKGKEILKLRWILEPGDVFYCDCTSFKPKQQFKIGLRFVKNHPDWAIDYDKRIFFWHRPPYSDDQIWDTHKIIGKIPPNPLLSMENNQYALCFDAFPKDQCTAKSKDQN